jgi:hypothetical protein
MNHAGFTQTHIAVFMNHAYVMGAFQHVTPAFKTFIPSNIPSWPGKCSSSFTLVYLLSPRMGEGNREERGKSVAGYGDLRKIRVC